MADNGLGPQASEWPTGLLPVMETFYSLQGEGANQNAKGSSRQPSSLAPAPSPAEPGRLTERQQLQRAIEESLLAHGGALQSLHARSSEFQSDRGSAGRARLEASPATAPGLMDAAVT